MLSSDKLDAWSLGVMAVELFSNQPPCSFLDGRSKVRADMLFLLFLLWQYCFCPKLPLAAD